MLDRILANKRREIQVLRARPAALPSPRQSVDVARALRRDRGMPLRLIAEVKLRSPSAGSLSRVMSPAERAFAYAEAGAAMISVLCDTAFFDGSWDDLALARRQLGGPWSAVPLLAKEFVLDERQVEEARARGADAVLLIARIVTRDRLVELTRAAHEIGIEPVLEVVDEEELDRALAAGARVIGVNARDLDTLKMDAARAARVMDRVPPSIVAIHFSGLREPADVQRVASGRASAALIGEALMRDEDPRPRLRAMVAAAEAATPNASP
ncbi:MAG: indole-3-glycerol phosphate synthase TrpC [Polyangiaceae bacterium]